MKINVGFLITLLAACMLPMGVKAQTEQRTDLINKDELDPEFLKCWGTLELPVLGAMLITKDQYERIAEEYKTLTEVAPDKETCARWATATILAITDEQHSFWQASIVANEEIRLETNLRSKMTKEKEWRASLSESQNGGLAAFYKVAEENP
jgi:hypothetical protein